MNTTTLEQTDPTAVFGEHQDTSKIPAHKTDPKAFDIDPTKETRHEFESRIAEALARGDTELETTPEIIKLYNPGGTGTVSHFFYKNIMVYPYGELNKIKEEMSVQLGRKTYGPSEGLVEGF
jgi:hypothetical protein